MKKVIASLVAVAGLSVAAQGQGSISFQVSPAGAENWSSSIPNATPGAMYDVRARVSYTGTAQPLGMASLFFQPTVSNWDNTGAGATIDALGDFVNVGGNITTPAGVVNDVPGAYGRIRPWGRTAILATAFLRGHVATNPAPGFDGTFLRIAQNQLTQWLGTAGNTSGGSGVPIGQLNDVGRTSNDPAFNTNLQNIVIFKYKITLSTDTAVRTLTMDAPAAGIGNRSSVTGNGQIYWFATSSEPTGQIRGDASVMTASISIVPTPASLALLGLGGLAIGRRRR
jgi:uncharacterized protein (TIGR03382 family)